MKQLILSFIVVSFFGIKINAQEQSYNWYFGHRSAVNFSTGIPVPLTNSQMTAIEGCASISDANGSLLFYTNGTLVFNRAHQFMKNADGLPNNVSSTQSSLIVPQPGNDSIYFLFRSDYEANTNGISYSVINIKRDGGLGEMITKNVFLIQPASEKLTAVRHCNNRDIWVIARGWNSDLYYAWLVTASGVSSIPITSNTGITIFGNTGGTLGYLKASVDGKKLVAAHGYPLSFIEISNFNNSTGIVSGTFKIEGLKPGRKEYNEGMVRCAGIEFSPDSKLFYLSLVYLRQLIPNDQFRFSSIYQFRLINYDSASVENSRVLIDSNAVNLHVGLQLGPDEKIYASATGDQFLSTINNPNTQGNGCNFQFASVLLSTEAREGLPNFISALVAKEYNYSYSNNCTSQQVNFQINNTQGYSFIKWNFGDPSSGANNNSTVPNPTHNFSAAGIYNVMLIVNRNNTPCAIPDTIKKQIWVGAVNTFLGADTTICEKDTLTLSTTAINNINYLWSTGSTANSIRVTNTGDYWLRIKAGSCVYSDTIKLTQQALPRFSLGNDVAICSTASVTLESTTVPPPGSTYTWSTNATSASIITKEPGLYWLKLTDSKKCVWRDTIVVTTKPLPVFSLGKDTAICNKSVLNLSIPITNANYLWSNSSIAAATTVNNAGLYWGEAVKDGCAYRDTIAVTQKPLPIVALGKDTLLCEEQKLVLNAFNSGASYVWQNNSILSSFEVTKAASYHVKVTLNGCSKADTINVDYKLKPKFSLGNDITICPGQVIYLQPAPAAIPGFYEWQNGTNATIFTAAQSGLYSLAITNECGTTKDSILLKSGTCKVYIPNAFTPNDDGLNDEFKALNTEAFTELKLLIFDRWGNKVFETLDKNKGWDGKYKGQYVPPGFFSYMIQYKEAVNNNKVLLKGLVQVIR